ncbi:ABC transporter substrate-binding protein [Pollutimonas harenae]|uniref:ABC transporter substrate-binding protein n=1 Tax=Pollutimonas harenae TaxID=657015 RepID=A0A853GRQ3_9BURK|nr:ABC transporter substrate-binding protein [Pollutimonas harenae]NYT84851.1 ABC transporter substrate-binding protein [Pollutimonas harenae]TEA72751.1 ABC transporter substrate-binding protein [Pollutimonas harenae]
MTQNKQNTSPSLPSRRKLIQGAAAITGLSAIGLPAISLAQNKPIRVGMPTILSGRVATLGISSSNAIKLELEKFNKAGGFGGRPIELIIRDSKGQPQEAARIARELVNSEDCEMLIDGEASSGAFAVHEVARDLGVLCIHTNSETSSLTADPKQRIPNAFRCARQGVHDSIVGGAYAGRVSKEKGLTKWMSASPDYAYGRDTTAEFFYYAKHFNKDIEVVGEVWPKLFQPDYSEIITRIVQERPQAIYSCLWGGDLSSFIDQASIYALLNGRDFFAVNMADYTVLTAVKNLPKGIHSGNRYLRSFPNTPANQAWGDAYRAAYKDLPTNWAWQTAAGFNFLVEAMKKADSTDGKKIADALRGLTIDSPFGTNGKLTMRAEDQTLVDYAVGWGVVDTKEPYMSDPSVGDWTQIVELENEWKKSKGYI